MNAILSSLISAAAMSGIAASQDSKISLPPEVPVFTPEALAGKVPAAKPRDVQSMQGILRAVYDVISGPAGARDWDRFRSLFLPQARFTQTDKTTGSTLIYFWSVDEFMRDAGAMFAKDAFYEKAIVDKPDIYGQMAQVFSSYESRRSPKEKPFQRGINSIQLLNDVKRWWVISILWGAERPGNPLPASFAAKH
jgi:hypothetical protein